MTFREKWLEAVKEKNSVLCAGIDPAEVAMGRGEKGLPERKSKLDWVCEYMEAISSDCAAVKPNIQYFGDCEDNNTLEEIPIRAHKKGLVAIQDSKLADIGETNDAGLFYVEYRTVDAVTFSPFAGNLESAVKDAHAREVGLISMCLMSNPEFKGEKNMLVPIEKKEDYRAEDMLLWDTGGTANLFVKKYIQLAHDAKKYGVDAVVVGAPSPKNHISEKEISDVRHYIGEDMLVLVPGVGAQGGEAGILWKYFGPEQCIINVGRDLMFPSGSKSTPLQQTQKAKEYREMLNRLRGRN